MDAKLPSMKPDVVAATSQARPTDKPVRTSFSEVMARGAGSVVGGAESAMTSLPGTSVMAVAVRGGAAGTMGMTAAMPMPMGGLGAPGIVGSAGLAEGPGAAPATSFGAQFLSSASAAATGSVSGDGGAAASLQQSEQQNMYYLQLQQQVNQQSQTFETLSNVMKSESDTIKNAISNMH